MKFLLDSHALIWALSDPERLPEPVRALIEDPAHEIFVSAASAWEIAIKVGLGKIEFPLKALSAVLADTGFIELPVQFRHAVLVADLPLHHRDPFDRILVAQAIAEQLTLLSRDPLLRPYPVPILWQG